MAEVADEGAVHVEDEVVCEASEEAEVDEEAEVKRRRFVEEAEEARLENEMD